MIVNVVGMLESQNTRLVIVLSDKYLQTFSDPGCVALQGLMSPCQCV